MKPKRILFIHQVGCLGGAGTMLANIISALDRTVFEAVVVCPEGDGNEQLIAAGAEVRIAPRPIYQFLHYTGYSPSFLNPNFLKHAFMLWRDQPFWESYIRESGADIVCLNAVTLAPMARVARRAGTKVLCIVQETSVRGFLGIRTAWINWVLTSWMDAVIHISQFDRDRSNCRAPLVDVIPNWVDLTVFDRTITQRQARTALGIPLNECVILMMGGISRLKGTLPLIQAAAALPNASKYLIIVAGYAGPVTTASLNLLQRMRHKCRLWLGVEYRQQVLRAIDRHRLGERIRFIGMQTDVARLYAAADILVFPATRPHQARPVLEAGAMAKPVLVPDYPQLNEFVKNGYNGITYRNGNLESMTTGLQQLLSDRNLARAIGENNYSVTSQKHDGAINAARFQNIFVQLAKACNNVNCS
jgi:glycosyltransferase involved in cell wall biosynthesis